MFKFNLKNYWCVIALIAIFLFSYYIRTLNMIPDRMLSFDPIFQYRYTRYFVEHGNLPLWDELSYYTGRATITGGTPLMYYITGVLYWLLGSLLSMSLLTFASYMSAIYGALIIIPAFLLGREVSNKYGGLLSAFLIGTAPQILIRTFGSSYDTDQIVLFFILLTLYLGFLSFKKKNIATFALAFLGFAYFMLAWLFFFYTFLILAAFIAIFFIISFILDKIEGENKRITSKKFKTTFLKFKLQILILVAIFILLFIFGMINNVNTITYLFKLIGFAQTPERSIVNISIAELQPFDIFNIEGWILATGRFVSSDINTYMIFIIFILLMMFGFFYTAKKKNYEKLSFLLTLLIVGVYTTFRGIRFTEFVSAIFLILIGSGFGFLLEYFENKKLTKAIVIGIAFLVVFMAVDIGYQTGLNLGPDVNSNWDSAWEFLRTQTPELSVVGTWWDPGHMITGLADRRVIADGAHCSLEACLYPINTRIVDLGNIMATSDENVSLSLIRKYQGDAPKVYWIASDDLIGKYQWLQYFGTGCDARTDSSCPLYMQVGIDAQSSLYDNNGNLVFLSYPLSSQAKILVYANNIMPIPIYTEGINAALFSEVIYYNGTQPTSVKFTQSEIDSLITSLKPLESQLSIRFTNQTIPVTVWIPNHLSYTVIIPSNLRNSVFTKMFMLEGQGLNNFKEVFRNDQVKIFEVL